jgi:signal transduction histidine kinase/CheY-like chemotaxis protein
VLEREWGEQGEGREPGSLCGQRLADVADAEFAAAAIRRSRADARSDGRSDRQLVMIPRRGGHKRTFDVVRVAGGAWLIGQPLECDTQRDALEQAQRNAEQEAREYARVTQQLRAANEQLEQRTEALREATEAKARFLAAVSHELRTPLNAVLGYAGLLRDGVYGVVSDPQDRAVRSIMRRAHDLQLLIDDVLDLSKIESGRAELRIDEFEPATVLHEVKEAIAPFARDKALTITLRTNYRDGVRLDRGKYKQVVLNLATNAVKFTPRNGEVELALEYEGDHRFVTRVRDTGIGIAQSDLPRIFEDFQQLDDGSTRRYQGLGLGLPIVRRIVELLGGTIEVDSEPGRGTTFRVALPTRPASDTIIGEPDTLPAGEERSTDPIVVSIDDDPEVIALLRDSLAPAHFRVVGALSGDRGKELAHILHPLAITLDIMMPDKDGWQVLREIKADPELADIPVIAMSIVSERALGFSLGVTDYLVKPVDRRVLIDVLERLRRRQALHTALVVIGDDDAGTLMHDLLTSLGFTVRIAGDGRQALEALDEAAPDVLFVDVGLPASDRARVLDALARNARYATVRTVLVTRPETSTEHEEWLRRAPAAVVYRGPEQPDDLLRELRHALAAIGASAGVNPPVTQA